MPHMCLTGHTLKGTAGGLTQCTVSCQANVAFTAVLSSLQLDPLPSPESGVFNDLVTYIVRRGDDFGPTGSLVDWLSLAWLC